MPKEMPLPRYLDKDAAPGTKVVTKGEYLGATEGRYGPQHNFMELDTNQHVVLSGGSLNWRVEQGHMVEGEVFDITYEGREVMTKGDFKGKESKNYKFAKYEDDELPEAFLKKRNAGAASAGAASPSAPAPKSAENEALDDLT